MPEDPTQSQVADVKAESSGDNAPINVKVWCKLFRTLKIAFRPFLCHFSCSSQVVSSSGDEVFFKIKRNTKLSKLQGAYANKVGKDVASIR